MEPRVLELLTQLGHVYENFVLGPRLGGAEFGQQPHAPALHARQPVMEIDRAGLLVALVAGPWPNRPFIGLVLDVHEASFANGIMHRVEGVAFTTGSFTTGENVRTPGVKNVVLGQTAIVTLDTGTGFQLFDPSARLQLAICKSSESVDSNATASRDSLVALLVDPIPLGLVERADHDTHVNQVEGLAPGPFLEDVVDLQHTVGRHPRNRRREEVNSSNGR